MIGTDSIIANIGSQIKEIRRDKNLTIQDLADATGLSKGMLSKIENGRTIPSLTTLATITQALEVDLSYFFNGIENGNSFKYLVKHKEEYRPFERENAIGFFYEFILSKRYSDYVLETVLLEVEPNAQREKISTDAYEFKYILEGKIEYHIGEEIIMLKTGDSLFFDGRIPHVPLNPYLEKAKILVVYLMMPQDK